MMAFPKTKLVQQWLRLQRVALQGAEVGLMWPDLHMEQGGLLVFLD
jgi:hypothetical protein